ncbi:MAG: hypothetical protein ACRD0G_08680 [Acidimicrobiales bacterium]
MARARTTFGKLNRDREKQAKANAKRERREARALERAESSDKPDEPKPAVDAAAVMDRLEALHREYDDGGLSLIDFERRRDELLAQLQPD